MTTYTDNQIPVFIAISLKAGLKLYRTTGIKPNTSWTPKAMRAKVAEITGETFRPRDYNGAIQALEIWIAKNGEKQ